MESVIDLAKKVKKASKQINLAGTCKKNEILENIKKNILDNIDSILKENFKDVEEAKQKQISSSFIDRLTLNFSRVKAMADVLQDVIFLKDPIDDIVCGYTTQNGLKIEKIRVPLGVVGIIYESRPNVTIDALSLCIKSGNSLILKGGKEAKRTNNILFELACNAIEKCGISSSICAMIDSISHEEIIKMTKLKDYIDVIIPRGGKNLIESVALNSCIPVIETGCGNCHIYVDESADLDMALNIVVNAKTSRPSVCNACESLLVNKEVAKVFLKKLNNVLEPKNVELFGCEKTIKILPQAKLASEEDYFCEYLSLKMSIKIVDSVEEAVDHIEKYSSKHSEAIITSNYFASEYFLKHVDSAVVYVNASTRFTDGGQFGLGAEMGISTQKLHVRGPMGLFDLTTTKTLIRGNGQIR